MSKRQKVKITRTGNLLQITTPENLHWKIFGKLIEDLGYRTTKSNCDDDYRTDLSQDGDVARLAMAIRDRSTDKLLSVIPELQPQRMLGRDTDAAFFAAKYQLGSFLKKYPEKGIDSREAALKKFYQAERICSLFNEENFQALLALNQRHPDFVGVLDEMRYDIARLLGEYPNVDRVVELSKHGPGTSVLGHLYNKGKTTNFFKWSTLPYTCTVDCVPYAKKAILEDPRWIGALDDAYRKALSIKLGAPIDMDHFWSHVLKVVSHSRLTTVPKTVETDRTICIEPLFNVFLQLGVDSVIRARLKARWGYDLNDQTLNQNLAAEGSVNGEFATIDLSAASDSVSLKICELLLPEAWYALLLDLRCAETRIGDEIIPLSKLSSMGNGYTFAIESLIFGAIARTAMKRTKTTGRSAVYGDDIVLPTNAVSYLKELLTLCGFTVNTDKSFWYGPFRESCGKDFFNGINVRPFFLKKKINCLKDLLYVYNSIWNLHHNADWTLSYDLSSTLAYIKKFIPEHIRKKCYGPPSESMDTYMFSHRKLPRHQGGFRYGYFISTTPRKYTWHYEDYFFIKLMCDLKPDKGISPRWDHERVLDSGNAFDITKRDHVSVKLAKRKFW